jgi:membrane fusion protein (multidrug efflux system)
MQNNRPLPPSRTRQAVIALGGAVLLAGLIGGIKYASIRAIQKQYASMGRPPEAVTTAFVEERTWRDHFDTVGTFAATRGVMLAAEEGGTVLKIPFESGAKVEAGQVLLELDHSVEDANLTGAQARAELARQNLARARSLRSQSALSAATLEDAQSKLQQSEAEVRSLQATIKRKTIQAPFAGRTGIRLVNQGEYVAPGRAVVPLHSMDPIFLNFSVPQQLLPQLQPGREVSVRVDAFREVPFLGRVSAVNPNVDQMTRTVEVQASLANADERLHPGMFAQVVLDLGSEQKVLAVPATSIVYAPYGNFVFTVHRATPAPDSGGDAAPTVRQQVVTVGERRGDVVAIVQGLSKGVEVVSSAGFKLQPGAAVRVKPEVQVPSAEQAVVSDS